MKRVLFLLSIINLMLACTKKDVDYRLKFTGKYDLVILKSTTHHEVIDSSDVW